jgi:hypothetical protein
MWDPLADVPRGGDPLNEENSTMYARFSKWLPVVLALAGFALAGMPDSAQAQVGTLQLRAFISPTAGGTLTNQATDQDPPNVVPGDTIPDTNPAPGNLGVGTSVTPLVIPVTGGTLSVFGSTSISNSPGTGGFGQLTSSTNTIINSSSSTVTVTLLVSDHNYTNPPSGSTLTTSGGGTITGLSTGGAPASIAGASATLAGFYSASNTNFALTSTIGGPTTFTPPANTLPSGPWTFALPTTGNTITYSSAFSMTVEFIFVLPPNTELTGRQNVEQGFGTPASVPEPTTVVSALTGVVLLSAGAWRKRHKARVNTAA